VRSIHAKAGGDARRKFLSMRVDHVEILRREPGAPWLSPGFAAPLGGFPPLSGRMGLQISPIMERALKKMPRGDTSMTARMTPPFRADHVGSILRSARLKEAREKCEKGQITADDLKAVEDEEI
jgi:hypothetical protein